MQHPLPLLRLSIASKIQAPFWPLCSYFSFDATTVLFVLQLLQNGWTLWTTLSVVYLNKQSECKSVIPMNRKTCQPLPRFFKIISQYSASKDLPLLFDIFWKGCSFLCLTDSCLTECKPAIRIGPHGLHLKGQELLTATTQSELRYSCHDWRKWRRGTV